MSRSSRRSFLKRSLFAGIFTGISAKSYRASFAAESPSERVRVGMIGVGNQGGPRNNMKYFLPNIEALCDVDSGHLDAAGAFLQKEADRSVMMTDDYRRLLDSNDLDAVVVTVPDQWHALMTIEACQAGKDVYCEKPLTLVIGEGRPMIDAARRHERVVQTGSMQRSGLEFQFVTRLVQSGAIGKVKVVNVTLPGPNWIDRAKHPVPNSPPPSDLDYDRWLGPAPMRPYNRNRVHYLFRFYWDYSGGQQTNFGAHHLDTAQWGLGMDDSGPVSVEGTAVYHPEEWYETPDKADMRYTYANGVTMNCRQIPGLESRKQGTEFIGENGSVFVWRGGVEASSPDVFKSVEVPAPLVRKGAVVTLPSEEKRFANYAHVNNFLDCVKTRETPAADISIGHRSATVCHLGNIAVRTGKKIHWDPETETITGDPEAAKWLMKEYRAPYSLT
ncbi:Inositol 2-dehydrogenase [Maioricimonas rarisocia]|uniref:Inositol 2-dehydrogenase n=1 Tax=Maioricimonas rarisocia TaxID=2528026 RepID=A0A517Z326_9PLAN|nr:Gfo/Idh/MocA family oxidoreductase [Maioricimonas rarisocia]QDU36858.1 Inositol 2-dehydrogenase [Maioricimonas rarisocia]